MARKLILVIPMMMEIVAEYDHDHDMDARDYADILREFPGWEILDW